MTQHQTKKTMGLCDQAVHLAPFAIVIVDSFGVISHANAKAEEMLFANKKPNRGGVESIVGRSVEDLFCGVSLSAFSATPIRKDILCGDARRTVEVSVVQAKEGYSGSTFVYINDAEHQQKRELFLEKEATTDELSGLANRRAFQRTMEANQHLPLSLAILDIDHFKLINDQHGHLAGDDAIRLTADLLTQSFETSAIVVSRMGGDEFSVLFETTDANAILKSLEAYRSSLCRNELEGHDGLSFSVSIGVALSSNPQTGSRTLLTNADRQLYLAKDSGRNKLAHILLT